MRRPCSGAVATLEKPVSTGVAVADRPAGSRGQEPAGPIPFCRQSERMILVRSASLPDAAASLMTMPENPIPKRRAILVQLCDAGFPADLEYVARDRERRQVHSPSFHPRSGFPKMTLARFFSGPDRALPFNRRRCGRADNSRFGHGARFA